MTVKFKDTEFTVKEVNTPKFRKETYFLISDYLACIKKNDNDSIKGLAEFFYPEVTEGEVTKIRPRFNQMFELFLDGDLSGIDYTNYSEAERTGRELITFFLKVIKV